MNILFLSLVIPFVVVVGGHMLVRRVRFERKRRFIVGRLRHMNRRLRRGLRICDAEANLVVRWSEVGYVKPNLVAMLKRYDRRRRSSDPLFLLDYKEFNPTVMYKLFGV